MNTYEQSTLPRLFELLEERKITAKQVSDATGISTGSLTYWRKGERKPKYEAIVSIATYLNVPVEYLLGTEQQHNDLDSNIQNQVSLLSEQQKKEVLKYIKFLKNESGE